MRSRTRHEGRQASPSAAIIDSQSVNLRGYDAGKKVKGRKRVVDSCCWQLLQDRDGAKLVLERLLGQYPRLKVIWADGDGGKLVQWAKEAGGWNLELVRRPRQQHTFQVLPRRWVVERFGWLNLQRRLSKDYEGLPETTEAWIYAAMTGIMLAAWPGPQLIRHPLRTSLCQHPDHVPEEFNISERRACDAPRHPRSKHQYAPMPAEDEQDLTPTTPRSWQVNLEGAAIPGPLSLREIYAGMWSTGRAEGARRRAGLKGPPNQP